MGVMCSSSCSLCLSAPSHNGTTSHLKNCWNSSLHIEHAVFPSLVCTHKRHISKPGRVMQVKWWEEWEEQDGCLFTQLPYHVVEVAELSMPTGTLGDHMLKHKDRVCWRADCGCFRVANKAKKGLTAQQLSENGLACQLFCSSASKKCFCHVLKCRVCAKLHALESQGLPVHQEGLMLRETQRVVGECRRCGHDWLVFVEVPISYYTEYGNNVVVLWT